MKSTNPIARRIAGILLSTLCAGAAAPGQGERVAVRPLRGEIFEAAYQGVDSGGRLLLRREGAATALEPGELVSIQFSDSESLWPRGSMRFEFGNGDVLHALLEGGNFDELKLASPATGSFNIFIDPIAVVWVQPDARPEIPERAPGDGGDDLILRRGDAIDRIRGEIKRFERGGVLFGLDSGAERLFRLHEEGVIALRLAAPRLPAAPKGVLCRVHLRDGGLLTGLLAGGPNRELTLLSVLGPRIQISIAHVRSIQFIHDSFLALGDLQPAELVETPYFEGGRKFGLLVNSGFAADGSLRIASRSWRTGVSLAARSEVRYELDRPYGTFSAYVGVDPMTSLRPVPGSVTVSVLGDGKLLYKSPLLVSGEEAVPLKVELGGARTFVLRVDFGDSGPTGAFASFADAMLVR